MVRGVRRGTTGEGQAEGKNRISCWTKRCKFLSVDLLSGEARRCNSPRLPGGRGEGRGHQNVDTLLLPSHGAGRGEARIREGPGHRRAAESGSHYDYITFINTNPDEGVLF